MQEAEQKQREMRERLAKMKQSNVQGLESRDSLFSPVDDYVERRRPITRLFFSVYDNLGVLLAINFFTFLLTIPLIVVLLLMQGALSKHLSPAIFAPLLLIGLVAPPAWAAASSYCSRIVEGQLQTLRDYWSDYRRLAGKAILLALVQWALGIVLVVATVWYFGQPSPVLKIVGVVSLYLFIFWAMAGMYVWPLMVRGYRWRAIVRNSAVLVISAPLRTISILVLLTVVSFFLGLSVIGAALLLFGLWAMLPNQALVLTRERLEKRASER